MLTVKQFTFNPVQENTYVVYNDDGECAIIDPGCYFPAERDDLKEFINENRLVPKYLLNTHCHLDHIFGNKWVYDTWGLELHMHELDKPVFEYGPTAGKNWGLPFENYKAAFHWLRAGDTILLGKDAMKVLFTPGHAPGHICFYAAADGFVISGDVLFRMSIGRTDLPGCDHERLMQSIREELLPLPPETIVHCGHGISTTIGQEKRDNPFLRTLLNQ